MSSEQEVSKGTHWRNQSEAGNQFMRRLLVWIALRLGRSVSMLVLVPTAVYFTVFAREFNQYSKEYLGKVFKTDSISWTQVYKHFLTFAICSVDKLFFLSNRFSSYHVSSEGTEVFDQYIEKRQGAILLVSHAGNFEMMKACGDKDKSLPIKIVMSRGHNAGASELVEYLAPDMADNIIDADVSPNELVLQIQEAIANGYFVGMMADRGRKDEAFIPCEFLGDQANFPLAPWLIASVLKAPVILCFGLYGGARHYNIYCEEFSQAVVIPRKDRQQKLAVLCQSYAKRLEHYVTRYPYNWFNFFAFWANK